MDSVKRQLLRIFQNGMFFSTITHDKISTNSYNLIKKSDYSIIGGSNLLSSNMNEYNQWKINLFDSFYLSNIILMGVGWWQYQKRPNLYTKFLMKTVLSKTLLHSVRDSYAESKLKELGIENVINTGCPTMWDLNKEHCSKIPKISHFLTDTNT